MATIPADLMLTVSGPTLGHDAVNNLYTNSVAVSEDDSDLYTSKLPWGADIGLAVFMCFICKYRVLCIVSTQSD